MGILLLDLLMLGVLLGSFIVIGLLAVWCDHLDNRQGK